jgi:hypothetical protein
MGIHIFSAMKQAAASRLLRFYPPEARGRAGVLMAVFVLLSVVPPDGALGGASSVETSTATFAPTRTVPDTGAVPYLSRLSATADDPLFATYAAPMRRSSYLVDEGYRFQFDEPAASIHFGTDHAGDWGVAFRKGEAVRHRLSDMAEQPVVTASYSDLVRYHYRPFDGVAVRAFFQVYSSKYAVRRLIVTNQTGKRISLDVTSFVRRSTPMTGVRADSLNDGLVFQHRHPPDGWTKRKDQVPHVTDRQDLLRMQGPVRAGSFGDSTAFRTALSGRFPDASADSARTVALQRRLELAAGASDTLRVVRGVADAHAPSTPFYAESRSLFSHDMEAALRHNERLYRSVPRLPFRSEDRRLMYWGAFNLMRQCMMPPEGKARHNYYLYSREPTWGWGHAGQVFHESLAMLAYAFLDPSSALHSQRLYMDRQWANGYIEYRAGPYLDATNFTRGDFTSSAPWFNYENWKLYRHTGNRRFLHQAYESGQQFYRWWQNHRDQDSDGLAEWGGHAVLESVRDANVAVWKDVGWPSNFEAPELNAMLVKEAEALAKMAKALGDSTGHRYWQKEANARSEAIRKTFWDEETGFFYYVDRTDHDFTFSETGDLKRQEIIGFMPLWAGVASDEQAQKLVETMTDTTAFWRPYGLPSLAANDPFYDSQGYWNGPVWIQWQYLIMNGLLDYGYDDVARRLTDRVLSNVIRQLETTHTFWEFYSPDAHWGGHHQTYIWTGIVARMLIDLHRNDAVRAPAGPD